MVALVGSAAATTEFVKKAEVLDPMSNPKVIVLASSFFKTSSPC